MYAAEKDTVIVLAAGNNAAKWEGYPGKSNSVLVVGASLLDDTRWEQELDMKGMKITQGSNYGNRLSVMAPVDSLMVCQPHEERWYDVKDSPMGPMKLEFSQRAQGIRKRRNVLSSKSTLFRCASRQEITAARGHHVARARRGVAPHHRVVAKTQRPLP